MIKVESHWATDPERCPFYLNYVPIHRERSPIVTTTVPHQVTGEAASTHAETPLSSQRTRLKGTFVPSKQMRAETQTKQQAPLCQWCQRLLGTDDGDPEGCLLSPGDISISSNPFHAQGEHLCPAWSPGTIRVPMVWRCCQPTHLPC